MNVSTVNNLLEQSGKNLYKNQQDLFKFTSETNQSEWNLAHHLANEIQLLFPDYECDLDIIKPNMGRKRPDIILHKRGNNERNFLVIEEKRDKKLVNIDLQKIQTYWFMEPLKYQFGAVVVLLDGSFTCKVISNS